MGGKCNLPDYVGDGVCDDENNNAGCNWDKGDCCGVSGNPNQKKYCKKCKCLDCEYTDKKDKCSGKKVTGKCGNTYVGDGVCDDVNNNAGCNWDKGDCCGSTKTYKKPYCTECKCKDCNVATKKCPKKKAASAVLLIGKATRTVMITTITARAIGMAEIAVGKKMYINIARLASVWTPPNKRAHKNADHRLGRTMVSATTTTTIVGVDGTKVIVAATLANRIRKSTAKSASVWIPKTQISH